MTDQAERVPVPGTRAPRRVRVLGILWARRVPEGAVYVGQGVPGLAASPWANPHTVGAAGDVSHCGFCGLVHTAATAVARYASYLAARPGLVLQARDELAGRDLACACAPGAPCHGDVLALVVAGVEPLDAWALVRPADYVPRAGDEDADPS